MRPATADILAPLDIHDRRSVACATVAVATATTDGERFVVELTVNGEGPPTAIRIRRWLKLAKRTHGLRCDGVAAVPAVPTAHLPATNASGAWRPRSRAIRRAATPAKGPPSAGNGPRSDADGRADQGAVRNPNGPQTTRGGQDGASGAKDECEGGVQGAPLRPPKGT